MPWHKEFELLRKYTRRRARATPTGRAILSAAAVAMGPVDYYLRRRAATRHNQQFPSNRMSTDDGHALLPVSSLPGTPEIVANDLIVISE